MKNRTTAADFALFKRTCEECIRKWGIVGWRVEFLHVRLEGTRFASCATRVLDRVAWISLQKEWGSDVEFVVTNESIVNAARHECTHLLLSPLADIVSSRYLTADEEKHANESVCRHIQSLLP